MFLTIYLFPVSVENQNVTDANVTDANTSNSTEQVDQIGTQGNMTSSSEEKNAMRLQMAPALIAALTFGVLFMFSMCVLLGKWLYGRVGSKTLSENRLSCERNVQLKKSFRTPKKTNLTKFTDLSVPVSPLSFHSRN